ncbi:MAG: shikimate kinase [Rickettsiales bacterium]|nr:shikimate kinase [Rickettsiales bacterium]|tara:strand:+ start:74 stop:607 length:534 start_codon:yes stop_codon:yes gene_type:complete
MILEKKKIVLVGMTGVGKTTIGRVLSKILRRTFIDIDFEVEKASGQKIHHIFEKYGENEFRKIEKKTLYRFLDNEKNFVISTGAGILGDQETIDMIKTNSICIFLEIKINNLVERLSNNVKSRPLLKKSNLKQKLENMIENRIQNYEQAHIIIPVDGLSIPDIVRRIINNLKYHDKN